MSILSRILAVKLEEVAAAQSRRPRAELEAALADIESARDFAAAIVRAPGEPVRVIAEIKRASPSAGAIRSDADPVEVARAYASNGAAAISVLTDESFFDGQLSFLGRVRAEVEKPLLRKDFIIDPYQVVEARVAGADAVLLIVAALHDSRLRELLAEAERVGLAALVEVHSEAEAERAAISGAGIVGVNHRDLATFTIDMGLTERLARAMPEGTILVGESGIRTAADVRSLGDAGAHAVLVGETLMRASSPGAALAELVEGAS